MSDPFNFHTTQPDSSAHNDIDFETLVAFDGPWAGKHFRIKKNENRLLIEYSPAGVDFEGQTHESVSSGIDAQQAAEPGDGKRIAVYQRSIGVAGPCLKIVAWEVDHSE